MVGGGTAVRRALRFVTERKLDPALRLYIDNAVNRNLVDGMVRQSGVYRISSYPIVRRQVRGRRSKEQVEEVEKRKPVRKASTGTKSSVNASRSMSLVCLAKKDD